MVDCATEFITRKRLGIMKVKVVSMRKRMIDRNFSGLICALVALSLLGFGCGNKKGSDMAARMAGMSVNVVAVQAKKQSIEDKISLVGSMAANESVEIKSEIDGAIEEIKFEEGQNVEKGQLLIAVDKSKLEASLAQAEANLKLAETTGKRYQSLVESQAISKQEFDQAQGSLEAARASADLVRAQLRDATIEAPFAGVMGERLISVGQFITKGASLTFLISQNPMKAEFHIPEKYLGRLKEKQTIEIAVAAYPNEVFKGEVYFIDPQINALTRTALVKALVPNLDRKLRVGMFANLDLIVNVREDAIVIPETALIPKDEEVSVFVIDAESKAQPRLVKVGIRMADFVEILSGLAADEKVITEGFQKIGPGSKVTPRDTDEIVHGK
jgi:membrane fusion protein (multidrug efflux system)